MPLSASDRYRRIADRVRRIPDQYGVRPFRVFLRLETWSGGETGVGTATTVETEITPRPKVRHANPREIALGLCQGGDYVVGPFTPSYVGGGFPVSALSPTTTEGQTLSLVLRNEHTGDAEVCRITQIHEDAALHFTVYGAIQSEET